MTQAKLGDTVRVHYRGTFTDGTVFDGTIGDEPFELTLGDQKVISGFENAIVGMTVGERKVVKVPPEEAYGKYDKSLLVDIEKSHMPEHLDLQLGKLLEFRAQDGSVALVTIRDITEKRVTLDGNHPLAGRELIFEIELVEIVS
ncbi:MAG TPA: peptidylprolyl isomerase [Deltaproteobacteria bacterium]|nr:MAG: peptidylprolyl isomerase [Deltaproteobacteria bacterium]HEC31765.1 peptidylprolyl isomerase [Deltaproteobacteria bacterium]